MGRPGGPTGHRLALVHGMAKGSIPSVTLPPPKPKCQGEPAVPVRAGAGGCGLDHLAADHRAAPRPGGGRGVAGVAGPRGPLPGHVMHSSAAL